MPGYFFDGAKTKDGRAVCKFDMERYKKSAFYQTQLKYYPDKNVPIPVFAWFGEAPFCRFSANDVWISRYIPIKPSDFGDGSKCWTGEKWLGLKPITKEHEELVDKAIKGITENKQIDQSVMLKTLEIVKDVTELILAVVTGA
jgi:hypothetical protein